MHTAISKSLALFLFASFASASVMVGACGGGMPPVDRLASAESSARSARDHGAEKQPKASLHLKLADEKIAEGKKLMADGDNKRADLVLQCASADAELANMLAKEAAARAEAEAAQEKVANLKSGK